MASGDQILALDYNTIRDKVASVWGNGSGSRGYGQPLFSSAVFGGYPGGNIISKAHWDNLRYDITNAYLHQTGVLPTIVTLNTGDYVGYGAGHPNNNYDTLADQLILNRFSIGAGQSTVSSAATQSRTGSWTSVSQCTLTVTFADADNARYFFNSGGKIRFNSSRTGGSSTAQNNSWTTLLNTVVNTVSFGANTPDIVNFYTLTTSYQQFYQAGSSGIYTPNYFRLEALCNCSGGNNATGTASTVTFRITWNDGYVDLGDPSIPPPDGVDGTLTLNVEEFKAAGSMTPSGTIYIPSPVYSLSAISAT